MVVRQGRIRFGGKAAVLPAKRVRFAEKPLGDNWDLENNRVLERWLSG